MSWILEIQEILEESPNMGEKMLQEALQSRGIRIQQRGLRSSIERVDPIRKVLRRLQTLRNALWLVFFHPSFPYRVYFQICFFPTKRFKKSLYQ